MKALYIWDSEYPWDIRVEKTCETLIQNGWEVHMVCRNALRRKHEEKYEGINIHRIRSLPKLFGKLNGVFTFPAFFSPVWLWRINQVIKKYDVDLIIARDLPISPAGLIVGKLRKIPVILDMAECYPEMIRLIWQFEPFKLHNVIVRNPYVVEFIEKIVLKFVDHVFVMIEESKQRLLKKNYPDSKVTIISNTPRLKNFTNVKATFPGALSKQKEKLILLYVGILDHNRGLDTVIESLKKYIDLDKDIFLSIIGAGNAEEYLHKKVDALQLSDYIGFEGWVDNKLVPDYIASSDICLVPHHKCGHWDNTIPNKLFDYMAAAKPVLISNVIPMERIVNKTECGLVYDDFNINSFVGQLEKLKDKKTREVLGGNGLKAVLEYYNWDKDSKIMIESMEKLVSQNRA